MYDNQNIIWPAMINEAKQMINGNVINSFDGWIKNEDEEVDLKKIILSSSFRLDDVVVSHRMNPLFVCCGYPSLVSSLFESKR